MNKVYKVIWSKAKQCYVVVSEIAKNTTKGRGKRARQLALAAIVGIGVAASTGVGVVHAAAEDYATEGYVDNKVNQAIGDAKNDILRDVNNIIGGNSGNAGGGAATSEVTKEYVDTADQANATAAATAQSTANEALDAAESAQGAAADAKDAADKAKDKADQAYEKAGEAKEAAADALTDAKDYTDEKVAQEVTDRNTAIATAKGEAKDYTDGKIDQEVTDRNAAIATAKSEANTYTDGKIDQEVTDRNAAIATAKSEANTYTDGKVAAEETRAKAAEQEIKDSVGAVSADGRYIQKANTVADNMVALDTQLAAVSDNTQAITYAAGSENTPGVTTVAGNLVVSGSTEGAKTITVNTANGTISGLNNTSWATNPALEGSSVAATQGQLYDIASKGFQLKTDNGSFNAPLATDISLLGDGKNITTSSAAGSKALTVSMKDDPTFREVTSSVSGGTTYTKMDNTGFYVTPSTGSGSASTVSLTSSGLNNGRNQLKNIADGTDYTDAVTYKQLIAERIKIQGAGDAEVTFAPIVHEGTDIIEGTMYTITVTDRDTKPAGDGITTSVTNGNVVGVRLPKDAQGNYIGSIIATEEEGLTLNPVLTLNGGAQSITFDAPSGHITGLTNIKWYDRTDVDATHPFDQHQAATEGQIKDVVDTGWVLGADNATGTLALSKTANVLGGTNIQTELVPGTDGHLDLTVSTTPEVTFEKVTVQGVDPTTKQPVGTPVVMDSEYVSGLKNLDFFTNDPAGIVVKGSDASATYLATTNLPTSIATSSKAATEAQLYDAVKGLDAADRYITNVNTVTSSTGTTVTLTQNNAANIEFTIPPTTGGGGGSTTIQVYPDDQRHPIAVNDGNADNWYIRDGEAIYENTTLATMDSTRPGKKSSVANITGDIHAMDDRTAEQITTALNSLADADGNVVYGQNYTVMDTAGNAVQLTNLASASVLQNLHGVVINHDGRIRTLEEGFNIKAGTETSHTGSIQATETLEFTGNVTSTNNNIKIDYDSENDKIDISVVDSPKFTDVEIGTATGKKAIIDSNGVSFDGNYYIGPNGLDGNGRTISRVGNGSITSTSMDAINGSQLYPVKRAVEQGFTVNGHTISLIGEGAEGFNIAGGKNIDVATNGSTISVKTVDTPEFTAVTVGTVTRDETGKLTSTPILINEGNQGTIRNLQNKTWNLGQSVPYSGQAATEDQLAIIDTGLTNLGMNFKGDDAAVVHKNLGETLNIVGGASTATEQDNIYVQYMENNGNPYLKVNLAKDVDLTMDGSIIVNNVTLDKDGLSVTNNATDGNDQQIANYDESGMTITRPKTDKRHDIAFTDESISAGDLVINNVASGVTGTVETDPTKLYYNNAATVGDVINMSTSAEGDKNITVEMVEDPTFAGKKKAEITLNPVVKLGADGSEKVVLNGTTGEAKFDKVTVNGAAGTITGLTNTTYNVQGKPNKGNGQAATQGQLYDIVDKTAGGWGLAADSGSATKQDIGKTLSIKGATVDGNKNITTNTTSAGVEVALANRVELGANDKVVLDGNTGLITAGTGDEYRVSLNGATGVIAAGQKVTLNGNAGTGVIGDINLSGTKDAATITGLSNKTWNPASYVSGQAATEDQLKAMADADTDYQLVANPDGGNYEVAEDGTVTLKVKDNKHASAALQDVIIEDVASATKLEGVDTRLGNVEKNYVKNVTKNQAGDTITITQNVNGTEQEVTFSNTNDYVVAGTYTVGQDGKVTLARKDVNGNALDGVVIEGIASSSDLDNATLAYKANNGTAKTTLLSAGLDFTNGTNTVATIGDNGVVTFDLAKDIVLAEDGSVTIGDTNITGDSINVGGTTITEEGLTVGDTTITGDNISTTEVNVGGTTITDGSISLGNQEGDTIITNEGMTVGDTTITGDSISTNNVIINGNTLTMEKGSPNVSDDTIVRIKYNGQEVATLQDGMKFSADKGDTVVKKLNETLPINGDKNIETITTEGGVQVTLKDIVTLNDAQGNTTVVIDGTKGEAAIGDITINKNDGATINNLSNTDWDINNITSGQAATEDQLKQAVEDMTSAGMYFAGDGISATDKDSAIHRDLDEMLRVQGGAEGTLTMGNIGVVTDKENGILSIHLAQNIDLGKEGSIAIGSTTVNGETVNVGGENGTSITETGLTVGDKTEITNGGATIGEVTIDGDKKEITVGDSTTIGDGNASFGDITINEGDKGTINNLTNTQWGDNYTITPGQAATEDQVQAAENEVINKGLNFVADDGTQIHKALGEELAITGGATGELTQGNIGVNNKDGAIVVELAKDINLGETGSVTIGDTNITNEGMTVGDTTINGDSVNVGGETGTTITETGVTVGDKTEITNGGATFGDVTIDGDKKEITVGDKTTIGDGTASFGDITINSENGGTINNLSNTTWDINNIVSGQAATEDQVKQAVESVTDAGMNFVGDDGTEIHKKLGETLAINGDQTNIHVESSNGGLVVSLDKDLKVDTITVGGENGTSITEAGVTVGDTTITGDSVNVGGENGTSITEAGVTVGDKTEITNGGATFGDVAIDGEKKEITVGEKTTIGDGNVTVGAVSIDGEKNVINNLSNTEWKGQAEDRSQAATEGQLEDAINDIKETGLNFVGDDGTEIHKNLGETLAINGDKTNIHVEKDGDGLMVSLDKDIKVDSIDVGDGKTVLNSDGSVSIAGGKLTVDKDGAINSQYTEGGSITADGNGFVVDNSGSNLTVNDKGTTISNGDTSTNINGSTITADNVTINGADGTVSITGADGAKADITVAKGDNNLAGNEQTRITYGDTQVATMADGLNFTADDEIVTSKKLNETLAINGDENITTKTTKDGVQVTLNKKLTGLEEIQVGDTIINGDSVTTENVITNNVEVGGPGEDGRPGKDGQITVNSGDGSSQVAIDGKDGISVKGEDGGVTIGTDGTIGIDGQDGSSASITVEQGPAGVKGEDGETITRIVYDDQTVATLEDGMKYSGDSGEQLKLQLNENVNIKGGADTENLTEGNIGVVSDGKDTLTVQLSKDLTGLESIETKELNADNVTVKETVKVGDNITIDGTKTEIQVGDTTVGKDGMTIKGEDGKDGVTVTKDKVDMAGNKVEGVADGTVAPGSMDAVNGSQLFDTNVKINKLSNRVNKVGAHAAALAALHPLDFDPDEKLTFSAGVGHYHSETAGAIGAFYRPDEKTMFSISGTMAEHDNMINAGVSFALDRTPNQTNSKTAMAKQILELTAKVEALTQANAQMMDIMRTANAGPKKLFNVTFPDLPKSHWAYGYVKFLADKGYVEGYPDGCFKGDRALTRYEFAAIVFRALQNGAPVDGNMGRSMDEFGPELENIAKAARFRVDRIKGVDDDRNKIERVRTNDEDDVANNDYRDVYGSKIAPPKTTK